RRRPVVSAIAPDSRLCGPDLSTYGRNFTAVSRRRRRRRDVQPHHCGSTRSGAPCGAFGGGGSRSPGHEGGSAAASPHQLGHRLLPSPHSRARLTAYGKYVCTIAVTSPRSTGIVAGNPPPATPHTSGLCPVRAPTTSSRETSVSSGAPSTKSSSR